MRNKNRRVCENCRLCDTCPPTTPRKYSETIENEIFNLILPKIQSDKKKSAKLQGAKDKLFKKWGINPKESLPKKIKVPEGVIVNKGNPPLRMSINSQLAEEILKNEEKDKDLIELAQQYLKLTKHGLNIEHQFRKEFRNEFNKINSNRNRSWIDCFNTEKVNNDRGKKFLHEDSG